MRQPVFGQRGEDDEYWFLFTKWQMARREQACGKICSPLGEKKPDEDKYRVPNNFWQWQTIIPGVNCHGN
jgi:hypothetical protein